MKKPTMQNRFAYAEHARATAYIEHLVSLGHRYWTDENGCHCLEASPDRIERTPGGIGHIPYADEDAADTAGEEAYYAALREAELALGIIQTLRPA